jgi:all-trans-retinol 13,14-reductase
MSQATRWDAIVIGSGLGGLSAGVAFANRGKRVLVLERLANFGGAATVYRHAALTMEASLHETDGDTVFGANSIFARLGLTDAVAAVETDLFYEARGGALASPIQVPVGLDNSHEALSRATEAQGPLDVYFRKLKHLHRALHEIEDMGARGPSALLGTLFSGRLFELIGSARRTVADEFGAVFGKFEAAKFALGAPIAYFDDDPAKLSFLLFAGVWSRYVESGSYYFKGGSRALSLALLSRVKERGGDARRHCKVDAILLDGRGRAAGVGYEDQSGRRYEALAPIIFAGAAPAIVAEMLPEDRREAFANSYAKYEPSISLFNVSLGMSRPVSDFGVSAYSTFVYPDDMSRYSDYPRAAAVFGSAPSGAMPPLCDRRLWASGCWIAPSRRALPCFVVRR